LVQVLLHPDVLSVTQPAASQHSNETQRTDPNQWKIIQRPHRFWSHHETPEARTLPVLY